MVASARLAERTQGQPTFLNLDAPYPKPRFTVVIWESDRLKFGQPDVTVSGQACVRHRDDQDVSWSPGDDGARAAAAQSSVLCTAITPPVRRGALCRCEARTLRLELAAYLLRTVISSYSQNTVVLENSNVAKLASTQSLGVHALP